MPSLIIVWWFLAVCRAPGAQIGKDYDPVLVSASRDIRLPVREIIYQNAADGDGSVVGLVVRWYGNLSECHPRGRGWLSA